MQRETIGKITCPFCATSADARKNKKGKLYFSCMRCGLVQPALPAFQDWILENVKIGTPSNTEAPKQDAAATAPKAAPAKDRPAPVAKVEPAQPEKPEKKSVFDYL